MKKGKLIYDGSRSTENIIIINHEKRSGIFHSIFWFSFALIYIIIFSLLIKPSATILGIFCFVLFFPIVFIIIGIVLISDSYRLKHIKIYENGIVPQYIGYFDFLLSRRKEIFLSFNDISIIYENPNRKHMSIVMKKFEKTIFGIRNEVYSIGKDYLSSSDYEKIKSILEKKVPYNDKINYIAIYG